MQLIAMPREEFYRLAERRENCLVDWEDGAAIRITPAHSRHGYFISYLHVRVNDWLKTHNLGAAWCEVFVDFEDRAFGTDIAALLTANMSRHRGGRIQGPPDTAIEVISDDSVTSDRTTKFDYYWQQKVPWYWIGDPLAGSIEEYQYTSDGYLRTTSGTLNKTFCPRALPGLRIEVRDLMEEGQTDEQP